eukprot:scaffold8701_cov120-Isochrysis_galbana.AAC.5
MSEPPRFEAQNVWSEEEDRGARRANLRLPPVRGHQLVGQLGHTGLEGRPSVVVRHRVARVGPKKDTNFSSA